LDKVEFAVDDFAQAVAQNMRSVVRQAITERLQAVMKEELEALVEERVSELISRVTAFRRAFDDKLHVEVNVEMKG